MELVQLTKECLRRDKDLSVDMIKADSTLTCKLKVLTLIMSNGNVSCTMDEDISGLQNRIREQTELELRFGIRVQRVSIVGQFHLALPLGHP